jgi:hypothetical protein
MSSARAAIDAYVRAKDENRPYLARRAFAEGATLAIDVRTSAIAFPPRVEGREAIIDILVRQFAQSFENVRTFCLATLPAAGITRFACPWLVGMSEKSSGSVRVGGGRYGWTFAEDPPHLATGLTITIEHMPTFAPSALPDVMDWLDRLPYPWCTPRAALDEAPALDALAPLSEWLAVAAGVAPGIGASAGTR